MSKTLNSHKPPELGDKEQIVKDGFAALRQTMIEMGVEYPICANFRQDNGDVMTLQTHDWDTGIH